MANHNGLPFLPGLVSAIRDMFPNVPGLAEMLSARDPALGDLFQAELVRLGREDPHNHERRAYVRRIQEWWLREMTPRFEVGW